MLLSGRTLKISIFMHKKTTILLISIALILVLFMSFLIFYIVNKNKSAPAAEALSDSFIENMPLPDKTIKGKIQGIKYEVMRESSIDHPYARIKTYDVVVPKVNRSRIEIVTDKLIEEITAQDRGIDKISLAFFSDKSIISSEPFDVAHVVWRPAGGMTREIADNDWRNNYEVNILMK